MTGDALAIPKVGRRPSKDLKRMDYFPVTDPQICRMIS